MKSENFSKKYSYTHEIVDSSNSKRILLVQRHILEKMNQIFLHYWQLGHEAVAYWYGKEVDDENTDIVLSLVVPQSQHSPGNYEVSVDETTKMGYKMLDMDLVCLAQIHTHPHGILTHSSYDDERSISKRDGFLSLVVPDYGYVPIYDLQKITVHERWKDKWQILNEVAKPKRIKIIDDVVDLRVED